MARGGRLASAAVPSHLLLAVLSAATATAQPVDVWTELPADLEAFEVAVGAPASAYELDAEALEAALLRLPPARFEREGARTSIVLTVPVKDIEEAFVLEDVPVLSPDLARRYPQIRTLAGPSQVRPQVRARVTRTPHGVHARIFTPEGVEVVHPVTRTHHLAAPESMLLEPPTRPFETAIREAPLPPGAEARDAEPKPRSIKGLRTYRLAVATTAGFAGTLGDEVDRAKVLGVLAAIVNSVDEVFERDLGIRLQLVPETDSLIFLDPRDEPFAPLDSDHLLEQSQILFDCVVGLDGYDVGHTLNSLGWSVAVKGSVGRPGLKGMGTTGPTGMGRPGGNVFDLSYFAHELGHQFGAGHTFTGLLGECLKFYQEKSAVEPGSGSTLMSYAGLCGEDDLDGDFERSGSDAYFHAVSIAQVLDYLEEWSACQPPAAGTGNQPPTIDAGTDVEIPRETRFWLSPDDVSEPDGDAMTFTWEQVDPGRQRRLSDPSCCEAVYRSEPPSSLDTVWKEGLDPCGCDCILSFAFTARDDHAPGGGVAIDYKRVRVRHDLDPFEVDEPRSPRPGRLVVRWRMDPELIVAKVRLKLLCGGEVLANAEVANDGEHDWNVPANRDCPNAAVQVDAVGHGFFAQSPNFVLKSLP